MSGDEPEPRPEERERCFRLVLEYAGTDFEGWQAQKGPRRARTVQAVVADALESIVGRPGHLRGAGRTDAGVHAQGQVASLRVATRLAPEALLRALNARLPSDVAVQELAEVPWGWDALREARGKHYRYQIWNGLRRSPLRAAYWHWMREPLDPGAMQSAAGFLVGRHDFAAFQGVGSSVRTTVRTLESLRVEGRSGAEIQLEVQGEGFLRHMVRNLAGTLIEVGRGRWAPERVAAILASRDRAQAGPTAPALGLVLVAVRDSWSEGEVGPGPVAGKGVSEGPSGRGRDDVDERDPVG